MRLLKCACLVILNVAMASAGYFLHSLCQPSVSAYSAQMPLDYLVPPQSFSEAENAKALLQALSFRTLTEIRWQRAQTMVPFDDRRQKIAVNPAGLPEAIDQLEQALKEFSGTGQESLFLRDLLMCLTKAKRYDRWLEIYLETIYKSPTCEIVGHASRQAVRVAIQTNREYELQKAFTHISGIPFDFASKAQIGESFGELSREASTAIPDGKGHFISKSY